MENTKKKITIFMEKNLLNKMAQIREEEGISVSYQLNKGAEQYLKTRKTK